MLKVEVEAEVHATENEEKVRTAITNVFAPDDIKLEQAGSVKLLVAKGSGARCLSGLRSLLQAEMIRDAARTCMRRGLQDGHIVFFLNKQAAYMGKVSFCGPERESPMGPLKFEIEASNPSKVIDWLAPSSRRGMLVGETEDLFQVEGG